MADKTVLETIANLRQSGLRDDEIKKLSKKYGEMGSGYPHDPVTIDFINRWTEKKGALPPFARASWDTNKRILDNQFQSKLGEYDTSK